MSASPRRGALLRSNTRACRISPTSQCRRNHDEEGNRRKHHFRPPPELWLLSQLLIATLLLRNVPCGLKPPSPIFLLKAASIASQPFFWVVSKLRRGRRPTLIASKVHLAFITREQNVLVRNEKVRCVPISSQIRDQSHSCGLFRFTPLFWNRIIMTVAFRCTV